MGASPPPFSFYHFLPPRPWSSSRPSSLHLHPHNSLHLPLLSHSLPITSFHLVLGLPLGLLPCISALITLFTCLSSPILSLSLPSTSSLVFLSAFFPASQRP